MKSEKSQVREQRMIKSWLDYLQIIDERKEKDVPTYSQVKQKNYQVHQKSGIKNYQFRADWEETCQDIRTNDSFYAMFYEVMNLD